MDNNAVLFVLLVIIGVIVAIPLHGFFTRCPNCKKWWSRKRTGQKELDRHSGYQHDTHSHSDGSKHTDHVYVTKITYENQWQCKKCNHQWTTVSTSSKKH